MINSKNLLHVCKHNFVSSNELAEFLTANPNVERRIGCLPSDWIKKIKKSEISNVTKLVDDIFEESALYFSYKFEEQGCLFLTEKLKRILKRSDINVTKAGDGAFKICHKLTVGKYTYALSTFKKKLPDCVVGHGKISEPQNIFTAYKMMSHGRVSKPFMSKLSTRNDTNRGYILSQFIEENKDLSKFKKIVYRIFNIGTKPSRNKCSLTPSEIKLQSFKFPDAKFGHYTNKCKLNVINGILFDVGGMTKNTFTPEDNEKALILNLEKKFIAESNIIKNACDKKINVNKISDYLSSLLNNGTNIYSADLRYIFQDLTIEEQTTAKKLIRIQRKLIKYLSNLNDKEKMCLKKAIENIVLPRELTSITKHILNS